MKNIVFVLGMLLSSSLPQTAFAQGPPITADKPIMLGSQTKLLKTLTEIRKTADGTFVSAPLMFHYLPSSSSLLGVHVPYATYQYNDQLGEDGAGIGDIAILGKYQFYRKDQTGKTFRLVAKTLQTLPTGKELDIDGISTGKYQSYQGLVAGYESIKYGISNELGYNLIPGNEKDELRYKLGFGLPLLKPAYPVNQVNLYFEYQNSWFTELNEYMLLYAQGIQYAKGRLTIEASVQFPLVQKLDIVSERDFSVFLGTRVIL